MRPRHYCFHLPSQYSHVLLFISRHSPAPIFRFGWQVTDLTAYLPFSAQCASAGYSSTNHVADYNTISSLAANWAALGICYNSGQDCTAGSRVYVQDSIYDKFIELLLSKVKAQTIGDGFDERTGGGPVVSDQPLRIA